MCYWEPEGFHQLGVGQFIGVTIGEVMRRMYEAPDTLNQLELANWLGIRQSWLSDAKRRNIVPLYWLQLLVMNHSGFSPIWVLTGKGERRETSLLH